MSLLLIEGFEHLNNAFTDTQVNDELYKMNFNAPSVGNGAVVTSRTGFQGIELDNGDSIRTNKLQDPTGNTTVLIGFFWRTPSSFATNRDLLYIYGGQTIQCGVRTTGTSGAVQFRRGTTTTLGTSSYTFSASNDYYVEFKIVVDDSSGSLEMRVADLTANGDDSFCSSEWTVSSVDSRAATTSDETSWDSVRIFGIGANTVIDDVYIGNGAGSINNDFLDNILVQTVRPDGAGNDTDLTPSTGSNYQNVDEQTADGDTTYNEATADGQTDLYTTESLADDGSGECFGVQVHAHVRIEGGGSPRNIRLPVRSGSTTDEGSDQMLLNEEDYVVHERIMETKPGGGSWASSDVNAMEIGIKRQS